MISWWQISCGAVLSGVVAFVALFFAVRPRRPAVAAAGAADTVLGAVAWNAILRAAHGDQFFTDAPLVVLPASWQDTGSGCSRSPCPGCCSGWRSCRRRRRGGWPDTRQCAD
jgi:hypothetical protein